MIRESVSTMAKWLNDADIINISEDTSIAGVCTDTRNILPGSLFIPIVGERFNGHDFVKQAIDRGAKAALWSTKEADAPEDLPLIFVEDTIEALQQLAKHYLRTIGAKVIAVTGSNGKTTTKDMMAAVCETLWKVQKTQGNFNNHIGMPLTILALQKDTEAVILEMGMSGFGEIELLSQIAEPDAAIITNIGESHLQDLGSRENIAKAKMEIAKGLKDGAPLVFHGDEPLLTPLTEQSPHPLLTFGHRDTNRYFPQEIVHEPNGTRFNVGGNEIGSYFITVLGAHNVLNAIAVIATARWFGIEDHKINLGFQSVQMTGMRLEQLSGADGVTIINDAYNASPTSVKAALELVQDMKGHQNKYVVLGDMLELGEAEEMFHFDTGAMIDPAAITGVFTYGTLSEHIQKGALRRFEEERAMHFSDKPALISHLKSVLKSDDLVLIKGSRGMKLEEVAEALL
ncbi:UDP-N-acetylmuramoyl-tripeptide--D-alanyl-D-alanine ligase [Salisediminibacterium selenitireducens]|uniref:UDP-N-acetylmuramoyl-tripeptide--D-alanyl-D-alanine ligase n=1 Tax=Bacillus selenitireducens (strain ATCC 700615 / DSM 15326 / MLS10) TaxID=439292 RepID=D6XU70_BACIE|nr:UDP-N-acetylmuramoyl-tripeptide--D-alanyl-D-alanine ligase [Salisediminibacterium selenitireducens]ADH99356.1 UDP-N-acetylmuramoylalanyl-D-glutamyl-2,6-diaminopimelate/D-alanyl-D-alanyl ligase [[Bacillus] selenitireducens MLS10]